MCSMCNKHLSGKNALLPDRINFMKQRDFQKHVDQLGDHIPVKDNNRLAKMSFVIFVNL